MVEDPEDEEGIAAVAVQTAEMLEPPVVEPDALLSVAIFAETDPAPVTPTLLTRACADVFARLLAAQTTGLV